MDPEWKRTPHSTLPKVVLDSKQRSAQALRKANVRGREGVAYLAFRAVSIVRFQIGVLCPRAFLWQLNPRVLLPDQVELCAAGSKSQECADEIRGGSGRAMGR